MSGWLLQSDNIYIIECESPVVQQNIRYNNEFLTKGCSCKRAAKHSDVVAEKGHETVDLDVCVKAPLILIQKLQTT